MLGSLSFKDNCSWDSKKIWSYIKGSCWVLIICLFFETLFIYQSYFNPDNFVLSHIIPKNHNAVLIYSGSSSHEEVNAPLACALHDLGYEVIFYIRDGLQFEGFTIPFTSKRLKNSQNFYGKCVDRWINIEEEPFHKVFNPKMIIFTSFPMKDSIGETDSKALHLLNIAGRDTKVTFLVHRTTDILQYSYIYSPYSNKFDINFFYLSEHTYIEGKKLVNDHFYNSSHFSNSYIMPVMPLDNIFGTSFDASTLILKDKYHAMYSLSANMYHSKDIPDNALEVTVCIKRNQFKNSTSPSNLRSLNSHRLDIDFIGLHSHDIPQFNNYKVNFVGDLSPKSFYSAISNTKFLIVGITNEDYYRNKASLSVPAALMSLTPIITHSKMLNLYPCLRDSKTLQKITKSVDCDSINNAYSLTSEDYLIAKQDMVNCRNFYWSNLKDTLHQIIS